MVLTTPEIRKLIRAHNVLMSIKIPPKTTRDGILKILDDKGYMVNHVRQSIQRRYKNERKPNITLNQAEKIIPKRQARKKKDPAPAPAPVVEEEDKEVLAIGDKPEVKVNKALRKRLNKDFKDKHKKSIYQVLEFDNLATPSPAEVKKRCRKLKLKNHPDKGGDTEVFQMVQDACDIFESSFKK